MPNVNLSTLSGPELRRLLDSARQRGEAALSYRILQEMEARREHGGERKGLFPIRRSAEARTVAVNLGDPMARDAEDDVPPMPFWRAPSQVAEASAEPEPPPPDPAPRRSRRRNTQSEPQSEPARMRIEPIAAFDDEPAPEPETPLSLRYADPEPSEDAADGGEEWDLRMHPPKVEQPGPRRGLRRGLAAGFAVGIAAGVGLGWWVWGTAREPVAAAPAAAPMQTASLVPPAAPTAPPVIPTAVEPAPAPEVQPEPAAPPTGLAETSPAPSDVPQIAHDAEAEASEPAPTLPVHRNAEPVRTAETPATNGCAAQLTPADRTICGDPELRGLQRQLRQAYNEALEAHEDRALLRQRQLAWASARDTVTDSGRLARLYEERIRKLNAATAAAREQR